ncbi:hypothetical protein MHU86_13861 [Fragilaria crotonensis]|nr:hypothetical protein MHU86_13861 [Fragilaria crotonensis]
MARRTQGEGKEHHPEPSKEAGTAQAAPSKGSGKALRDPTSKAGPGDGAPRREHDPNSDQYGRRHDQYGRRHTSPTTSPEMYRDPAMHTITRSDADPENANQATSSTASTPNADRSPSQRVRRYDRGSEASFIADATSARRARLRHEAASRESAAEGTPEPDDGKVGSKPNGGGA